MKRPIFILAMLACGASLLQAADLYDITLTNAKKYTQCRIHYSGSTTKFSGTDSTGKQVTLEIKSSSILMKKEVTPVAPTPAPEAPKTEPTPEAPKTEATPEADVAETASTVEAAPAQSEEQPTAEQPQPETNNNVKVQGIAENLRSRLALLDSELATLTKPSRSLLSRCNNCKNSIARKMPNIDKLAVEVAELQSKFNDPASSAFEFTLIANHDRNKFVKDGQAAYKAMLVDVKEYKNKRKVGGLDKFEVLRERYQGIPEYKEAHKWYMDTLRTLQKRWTNLQAAEQKKRNRMQGARRTDQMELDQQQYERIKQELEKEGEQIALVWINPPKSNLTMLNLGVQRVKDALRRNENGLKDENIGTVPPLLVTVWESMDKARELMIRGNYEEAEATLKNDSAFAKLIKLNRQIFPEDYMKPLREQRQLLEREITKRERENKSLERNLSNKQKLLNRDSDWANSQIDAALEQIAREKEADTQTSSVELVEKKATPAPTEQKQ